MRAALSTPQTLAPPAADALAPGQPDHAAQGSAAQHSADNSLLVLQTLQTTHALAIELNQPLNALQLFAEAGQRLLHTLAGPPSDPLRRCLDGIAEQAERAGQVLQQLVDFLPSDALVLSDVVFNDLVQHVVGNTRSRRSGTPATRVEVVHADQPLWVRCNPAQLEKVIGALVDNRLTALGQHPTPDALVRLTLRRAPDAASAQVSIQGVGAGQYSDTLETMFEAFFPTLREGPGLSLSLCRAIMASQGGKLWASELGSGVRAFHLSLGLAR